MVAQLFGTTINSVESNFIISDGETLKRYFHLYPSARRVGAGSVCVGSIVDLGTVGLRPDVPFSMQI